MYVMYKGCHKLLRMSSCFLSPTIQLSREVIQVNKVLLFSPFANPFFPPCMVRTKALRMCHTHTSKAFCVLMT